ncbi:YitT family protein [Paenibacillus sp. HB172176]|uniref:YitT family protein n=1 Tax=Paenibacillus sp. HB172176 TaxID=2493690 RepID=UPI001F107C76|nr:YitT family protein [Paenibacillus sp. HB172176]
MKKREFIGHCLLISLGSALFAFSLQYFVIPNAFMEGGVTGISLLLKYSLDVPPWLTVALFNIPLFLAAWRLTGRNGAAFTLVGAAAFSLFLWLAEAVHVEGLIESAGNDDLLTALYAGVTSGAGLGIVLRYGGSTGGSALIARLTQHLFGWKHGHVILAMDIAVIGFSVFYVSLDKLLYTLVMVFITARVIDFVTQEAYSAKAITVFTRVPGLLSERITEETERGFTLYKAKGGFTGNEMDVVYCVVSRSEVHQFKRMVKALDPKAFLIVHDVQEVLGEGFRAH